MDQSIIINDSFLLCDDIILDEVNYCTFKHFKKIIEAMDISEQ